MTIFDPKNDLKWRFPSKWSKIYNFSAEGQSQWEFLIVCDTFNHLQHNNGKSEGSNSPKMRILGRKKGRKLGFSQKTASNFDIKGKFGMPCYTW